ncbi:MAG: hypothetical protein K2O81_03515 [Clostridia bacterium]|nr:hypothetical protein [Clostridia bacterium]
MKKLFKIFAIAAIAVAAAVACVFAGCNKNSGESKSDYNFTIVYEGGAKDGQAVNGQTDGNINGKVATQICTDQCIGLPLANIFPDENGKLSLSQARVNELFGSDTDVTEFVFHALNVTGYKTDCEVAVNGKGDYTLKVTVG